jgi:plastocyanin
MLLAALVALGGCAPGDGGESDGEATEESGTTTEPEASDDAEPEASAGEPKVVAAAGEAEAIAHHEGLTGKISLEGPRPKRRPLVTDEECKMHADGKPLLSEKAVVDENGGLQWAFIQVTNPPAGDYPAPEEAVVLDQVGCTYTPHIVGVQAGQRLEAWNSDPFTHNVRGLARKNRPFNMGQPVGSAPRQARETSTAKAEDAIKITCDVHKWMTSFMFVVEHPFFAVSAADGSFTIDDLPDGTYDVLIWTEAFGEKNASVTVADGAGSVNVAFTRS